MTQLFPPEIIKCSSENYFHEQNTTGRIFYISALLCLILACFLLPLINVQVTTQSDGIVRSGNEDNPVVPVVSGEVKSCRMAENQPVEKDDTLLVISSDKIIQDIRLLTFRQNEENQMLSDLTLLISGESNGLSTPLYKQDFASFCVRLEEQKTQIFFFTIF